MYFITHNHVIKRIITTICIKTTFRQNDICICIGTVYGTYKNDQTMICTEIEATCQCIQNTGCKQKRSRTVELQSVNRSNCVTLNYT